MLTECDFEGYPLWLTQELLAHGCLNQAWNLRDPKGPRVPSRTLIGDKRVPVDPEQPQNGQWLCKVGLIFYDRPYESLTTFRQKWQYQDGSGPVGFDEHRIELTQPFFDLYITVGLERSVPESLIDSPSSYRTVRVISDSPFVYEEGWSDFTEYYDWNAGKVRSYWIDMTAQAILSSATDVLRSIENVTELPFDWADGGLIPPPIASFDVVKDAIRAVREATVYNYGYSSGSNGEVTYHYEYDTVGKWASYDFLYDLEYYSDPFQLRLKKIRIRAHPGPLPGVTSYDGDIPSDMEGYIDFVSRSPNARAEVDLIRKMHRGEVDLGVTVLEAKKTALMVRDRYKDLVLALQALKRRDVPALSRILRTRKGALRGKFSLENMFLEYQFGWVQLYNDINGLIKNLFQGMFEHGQRVHCNVSQASNPEILDPPFRTFRRKPNRPDLASGFTFSGHTLLLRGRDSELVGHNPVFHLDISPRSPDVAMYGIQFNSAWVVQDVLVKNLQALGILNPFVAAWDLVPWSFIADWVLSLDAILKSVSFDEGLQARVSTGTQYFFESQLIVGGYVDYEGTFTPVTQERPSWGILHTHRTVADFSKVGVTVPEAFYAATAPVRTFQISVLSAMAVKQLR